MSPCRFEDFVGDTEVFFSNHFRKRPLLCRGAVAARLADLPSVQDLDDVLALEVAPLSCLRVTKDGREVPSRAYTQMVGRGATRAEAVDPARVYELFRSGATITWDSLNHILPSARRLLEPFVQAFASNTEVLLFMTPAGNDGFPPHCDSIEVFVVQVTGTKSWRLWDTPETSVGKAASYTLQELGRPALEVTLCPGDVLYVPQGTPHAATARDALSVHLSVGVEFCRWRDMLRSTVIELLKADCFNDFPGLGVAAESSLAFDLVRKLELLQSMIAKLDPGSEVRRLTDVGRCSGGAGAPREFELLSKVDGDR